MIFAELTTGTDYGSYLNWQRRVQFDWKFLNEEIGVQFAVFRSAQEQLSDTDGNYSTLLNIQEARKYLPIVATYPWHYPNGNQKYWLDVYLRAYEKEQPDFLAPDLEQLWIPDPMGGSSYVLVDKQKFSDTAQELCEGLRAQIPDKQICPYTSLAIVQYAPAMKKWLPAFPSLWEALWDDYGDEVYYLTWEQIKTHQVKNVVTGEIWTLSGDDKSDLPGEKRRMRQYSSRILPPYPQGSLYAHQMDWNVFYGSLDAMMKWCKKEPIDMTTAAWDKNIKQSDRAWGWEWEPTQALIKGKTLQDTWVDIIELPMMSIAWRGNPGSQHMSCKTEETFANRMPFVNVAKLPVIGTAILDAGIGPLEQHPMDNFTNRIIEDNFILKFLMDAWVMESSWVWSDLFSKRVHFYPISQLNVKMVETHDFPWGSDKVLGEEWQVVIFELMINHLKLLRDNEQIPNVPIAFKTTCGWLNRYPGIVSRLEQRSDWLYLSLIKDLNLSTGTYPDMGNVFAYEIPETFNFPTLVKGMFERTLAHQFASLQKVSMIVDSTGKIPQPVKIFKYFTDKDKAYGFLNFNQGVVVPPIEPPVPPIPPIDLQKKLDEWRNWWTTVVNTAPKE